MSLDEDQLRQNLLDRHSDAWVNDDGDVLVDRVSVSWGMGGYHTFQQNLSTLYRNARRTCRDVERLLIEARILDEEGSLGNPAIPHNESVEEEARSLIESEGLEPGWV